MINRDKVSWRSKLNLTASESLKISGSFKTPESEIGNISSSGSQSPKILGSLKTPKSKEIGNISSARIGNISSARSSRIKRFGSLTGEDILTGSSRTKEVLNDFNNILK